MCNFAADMENRIKEVIKEHGFTMKEFAEVLGITRENLHSIIRNPSSPTLEKLSNALGVPVWQFFASPDEVKSIVCPHCGKPIHLKVDKWHSPDAYYRTQAKYRKYKADADELSYRVSGYEKAAAEDPAALLKLEEIVKGEDFVRMQIIKEAEKTLSQINKAANKAEGKERKELRQLYNQSVKEVVDLLDGVGKE